MVKVLSIGNSFSQDSQKWLHNILCDAGIDNICVNLYVGGCTLKRHYDNLVTGNPDYDWEVNGGISEKKISITEALKADKWDIVTLQQASHESGRPQSYYPYLPVLLSAVKEYCPDAKCYINKTWAYPEYSKNDIFARYGYNSDEMYRRLSDAYTLASKLTGLPLIKVGDLINTLRKSDTFPKDAPLYRDDLHLSHLYGRYAAALVWAKTLFGVDPCSAVFVPEFEGERAEESVLSLIKEAVSAQF